MNEQMTTLADRLQPQFQHISVEAEPISAMLIQHVAPMTPRKALEISGALRHLSDDSSRSAMSRGTYGSRNVPADKRLRRRYVYAPPLHDPRCRLYHTLANDAGNCIGEWSMDFGVAPETVDVKDGATRWLCVLFDLSWAENPTFPRRAKKSYLAFGEIFQVAAKQMPQGEPLEPFGSIRSGKPLNAADRRKIADLQSLGFHSTLINLPLASVYAIDVLAGKPTAKRRRGRQSNPEIARRNKDIVELYRQGKSVDDVVERYGINPSLAHKIKSEAGLTKRKQKQRDF